jgi:hypothetical protein
MSEPKTQIKTCEKTPAVKHWTTNQATKKTKSFLI